MTQAIQQHLLRAQQRMKHQADKHRQEREFSVGDWVYLKLQPHIQQSVHCRSNHKLTFKYFGPYPITERIGKVAYRLQLPDTAQIHPVIHVSQLKKALPPNTTPATDEHLHYLSMTLASAPSQVLDLRLTYTGNVVTPYALVQWDKWPHQWARWENVHHLQELNPLSSSAP
jgi:hypothetical protein